MISWTALRFVVLVAVIGGILCPPVTTPKPQAKPNEKSEEDTQFGLEYERYLKEIVSVLETDEQFRLKLEKANISDIKQFIVKSGDIAHHLEFVSHRVRTQLDEIKRREVDRLNQIRKLLVAKQQQGIHPDTDHSKLAQHVDHKNPETFEVDDLKKLIQKATNDLEVLDQERKSEFKKYEMEKEMLRKEKLKKLDDRSRAEEQQRFDDMQKKHQDHPKLHHPGGKQQLEEVWEEEDGMDAGDFDPKTFFFMHDKNGDQVLDEAEVEALFLTELDKAYDPDAPEDDMMEREEEMNRMREHVFGEVDKNGDRQIDLQEFLASTNADDFDADEPWDLLEEEDQFTDEELEQFQQEYDDRRRQMFDGNVQPGEINVPAVPSPIPDHMGDQPQRGGGVLHMNQQETNEVKQEQPVQQQVQEQAQQAQQQAQEQAQQAQQEAEKAAGNNEQQQQQQQAQDTAKEEAVNAPVDHNQGEQPQQPDTNN